MRDIYKAIKAKELVKAAEIGLTVAPFETLAVFGGLTLTGMGLYVKAFVPIRHAYVPYSHTQLLIRNNFVAILTNPAAKRTAILTALASWILDPVRDSSSNLEARIDRVSVSET